MEDVRVYGDKCNKEVIYHLIPRYNIEGVIKEIIRRYSTQMNHLCEPCMHGIHNELASAVKKWKEDNNEDLTNET